MFRFSVNHRYPWRWCGDCVDLLCKVAFPNAVDHCHLMSFLYCYPLMLLCQCQFDHAKGSFGVMIVIHAVNESVFSSWTVFLFVESCCCFVSLCPWNELL